MRRWKGFLVALLVVGGIAGGACYRLRQIQASIGYAIQVEFEQMPPDDEALGQWLKTQPGVVPNTAHVQRDGKSLRMWWIMTQSIGPREPPVPDFSAAFERFAYIGAGPIRDDPPTKP